MKKILCIATAGLIAATALAQTLVTTPVMGFLTLNVQQGTNFMGFALLPAMELQAVANIGAERTHLLLQGAPQVSVADDQFNPGSLPSYAVEISTAGSDQGFSSPVVDTIAASNEIVLADPVPGTVADGVIIKVWKLWTLADVFGATNTAGLTGGNTPETADLIQLPNGGGYDEYFYSTGGAQGVGWRQVGEGTADQAGVPLDFSAGFSLYARSVKSVVIVGQVKPGKTKVTLQTGNNFVANMCPVNAAGTGASTEGRTLANSGLQQALAGGIAFNQADLVLLWNGAGYDQYYYSTGGLLGAGWRKLGGGSADQSGVALPDGAYIIHRRGLPVSVQINQGNF